MGPVPRSVTPVTALGFHNGYVDSGERPQSISPAPTRAPAG